MPGLVRVAAAVRGLGRHARRLAPLVALAVALAVSVLARRQAPWISWVYLGAVIALGGAIWALAAWRPASPRRVRVPALAVTAALLVALLPVPWMTAGLEQPPGTAWRLDGRLQVNGEQIDPPGAWYWLTVGRPPIVAEVVAGFVGIRPTTKSLVGGTATSRPEVNEPAAVAVGLRAAGVAVDVRLVVELSQPTVAELPSPSRWCRSTASPPPPVTAGNERSDRSAHTTPSSTSTAPSTTSEDVAFPTNEPICSTYLSIRSTPESEAAWQGHRSGAGSVAWRSVDHTA
jgi:hypothetical protein